MGRRVDPYWAEQLSNERLMEALNRSAQKAEQPSSHRPIEKMDRVARWSLFLGLVSIPAVVLFGLGGVLGLVAIVLGVRALRADTDSIVFALSGVICGALAVLAGALFMYALVTFDPYSGIGP